VPAQCNGAAKPAVVRRITRSREARGQGRRRRRAAGAEGDPWRRAAIG